jgi:peroxiredoxin
MGSVRFFVVFVLVVLCVFSASCFDQGKSASIQAGDRVGDFRLETLAHDRFYLNAQRGKIVVLVFWSTDCKHCKKEMIDLNDAWKAKWKKSGVILAAPCVDPENVDEIRQFAKNGPVAYPILLDENMGVFRKYGLHFKPTTVVIDGQGVARLVRFGYSDVIAGHIEDAVRSLLTGTAFDS